MRLSDKTKEKPVEEGRSTVTVVKEPLTEEEAREMFPYRPHSQYSESRFGGDELVDDVALLLNDLGKRCKMCTAVTRKEYLTKGICPDCDGRSEYNGEDPRA